MNCEELDKRTKAYKECIKSKKDEGLGDTIERITKATGIKKAVDYVFDKLGVDCGCEARKEKLNKLFKYDVPKCLTESEYQYLDSFFNSKTELITGKVQGELLAIYNRIFSTPQGPSSCGPCVRGMIDKLRKVYSEYDSPTN